MVSKLDVVTYRSGDTLMTKGYPSNTGREGSYTIELAIADFILTLYPVNNINVFQKLRG